MNLTAGGLLGYCSSKCMTSRKVPSSNGVSAGPIMTAFLMIRSQFCVRSSAQISVSSSIPGHDIIGNGGCRHAGGRVGLHALDLMSAGAVLVIQHSRVPRYLEVSHQTATGGCRHGGKLLSVDDECGSATDEQGAEGAVPGARGEYGTERNGDRF